MWRTHSCVPRRHSCRRPLSHGAKASSRDSTLHAGVRAPRHRGILVTPRVVIIGGGISGLPTAYYLARGGTSATMVEPPPRLGGVTQTKKTAGCTMGAGRDSTM